MLGEIVSLVKDLESVMSHSSLSENEAGAIRLYTSKILEQVDRAKRIDKKKDTYILELEAMLVLWKLRGGTDPALTDLATDTVGILEGGPDADRAREIVRKALYWRDQRMIEQHRWGADR